MTGAFAFDVGMAERIPLASGQVEAALFELCAEGLLVSYGIQEDTWSGAYPRGPGHPTDH